MTASDAIVPGSFRDPSGFVFLRDGSVYRQVNATYAENYDHLVSSGLYGELAASGLMLAHEEVDTALARTDEAYKVLRHEPLPFISYPYEWCFGQLRDAALLTLEVQKKAFDFGMTLKDASAYNIQFHRGRPVLIDTLSFEKYRPGQTWTAYRQFCQHFLAPLALASYRDPRLGRLSMVHLDGIPLDLASRLLPLWTRLRPALFTHVHLHASFQSALSDSKPRKDKGMGSMAFRGLIDSLGSAVRGLKPPRVQKGWHGYYSDTNYSPQSIEQKKALVARFLEQIKPESVWDLGANTGEFSRIPAGMGIRTVSFDLDHACVEENYRECARNAETNILPLVLDVTNPSPGTGWENEERRSLIGRGPVDTAMALALAHHLAISNNLPLGKIAAFFAKICRYLVIEFVPKEDSQVKRLLAGRSDIFVRYDRQHFEEEFGKHFMIIDAVNIKDTQRTLYMMKRVAV